MKKLLLPLLCVVILSAACGDDNPRWDGTYVADGEWEVWSGVNHNDCFMLDVGADNFHALLESDAAEENYTFTGSEDGERCWSRTYERVDNELRDIPPAYSVAIVPPDDCLVRIERERVITLVSDDAFSEVSSIEVFCQPDANCPPELITCAGDDTPACTAEFSSVALRCEDCFVTCEGAAMVRDPELNNPAVPGS